MGESDFIWAHALEPWHAALFLALAAVAAWWGWRGYGPTAPGLAGTIARLARASALALAVLLLAGPSWRTTTTTILPGRLVVAVDTSASMARPDGPGGLPRLAVAEELKRLLDAGGPAGAAIEWRDLATGEELPVTPWKAQGGHSRLGDDLERLVAARRPDALVVVTDGRVTAGKPLPAAAVVARDMRSVLLGIGSETVEPELTIDAVEVNREVALGELEPISVRVAVRGLTGPLAVRALVDGTRAAEASAEVVAGAEPTALVPAAVTLAAAFTHAGRSVLRIEATVGGLTRSIEIPVTVAERRLAVLYLEQRPRYDARYLRDALGRDASLTIHSYLADGKWRRWGANGPTNRPLGRSEIAAYDVIILGDLGPDPLPAGELAALTDHIRTGGAGLVVIPGETGATAGFARSALGALFPVELPGAEGIANGYLKAAPQRLRRTGVAESLGLLDSGGTPWSDLAPPLGACPIISVRPGADVLAENSEGAPLVISRAAGRGRCVLIAIDDTFRWRRQVGDRFLHRFHSQLLRHAAAGRRAGGAAWRVIASPPRVVSGEPVTVSVIPTGPVDGVDQPGLALRLAGPPGERVVRLARAGAGWTLRLMAPEPGAWTIAAIDSLPGGTEPTELTITTPADESRDPRADRAALTAAAEAAGAALTTTAAATVAALPKDLGRREATQHTTGWWDTGWALAALITLLAIDWSIRRWNRLP